MHIGLLLPGAPPPPLDQRFPDYGVMCADWLQSATTAALAFTSYKVYDNHFPEQLDAFNALVILGSPASAYEPLPWIASLETTILEAVAKQIPMFGICFGHQIIAQALGGRVEKASAGWGVGVHQYQTHSSRSELALPNPLSLRVSHQDQVTQLPQRAIVVASSAFCPYAALYYPDTALTFQGHPEFSREYSEALLKLRRGDSISQGVADEGMASLSQTVDNTALAELCLRFFNVANKRQSSPSARHQFVVNSPEHPL